MKALPRFRQALRVAFALALTPLVSVPPSARATEGVPQPKVYAALLVKARNGTLQINYGERAPEPKSFLLRMFAPAAKKTTLPPDVFAGQYRKTAKTSFMSGTATSFATLGSPLGPLPQESSMSQQFPALLTKAEP